MNDFMEKENIAKPLLKWPGGKRRVLKHLEKYIPERFNSYVEPFFGGGALFFNLKPTVGVINDYNSELVNVYLTVKNFPAELVSELEKEKYSNSSTHFLNIRGLDRDPDVYDGLSSVEKAARTLFLNRTCFNGIYRVNSKNQFNVPFGKYDNPKIVDKENIFEVHHLLNSGDIKITSGDYKNVLTGFESSQGSFIYLDPPYAPLTDTASFVSYTDKGFDVEDQVELRDIASALDRSGNHVLLSNSDTPIIRELYKDFLIIPISVQRSVGASANTRIGVGEVLILGSFLAESKGLSLRSLG